MIAKHTAVVGAWLIAVPWICRLQQIVRCAKCTGGSDVGSFERRPQPRRAGGATSTACRKKCVPSAIRNSSPISRPRATGARSTIAPTRSASFAIRRKQAEFAALYEASTASSRQSRQPKVLSTTHE